MENNMEVGDKDNMEHSMVLDTHHAHNAGIAHSEDNRN